MEAGEMILIGTMILCVVSGTLFSLYNLDVVFGTTAQKKRAKILKLSSEKQSAVKAA